MQFISNSLLLIFSLKHPNTLKKILLSHTCKGIPPHMQNLAFLLELHKDSVGTGFRFLKVPVLNLDHLVCWTLPSQVFWRSVLSHHPREDTELHQLCYPTLGYFILYQSYDFKQLNIMLKPSGEATFQSSYKMIYPTTYPQSPNDNVKCTAKCLTKVKVTGTVILYFHSQSFLHRRQLY